MLVPAPTPKPMSQLRRDLIFLFGHGVLCLPSTLHKPAGEDPGDESAAG